MERDETIDTISNNQTIDESTKHTHLCVKG